MFAEYFLSMFPQYMTWSIWLCFQIQCHPFAIQSSLFFQFHQTWWLCLVQVLGCRSLCTGSISGQDYLGHLDPSYQYIICSNSVHREFSPDSVNPHRLDNLIFFWFKISIVWATVVESLQVTNERYFRFILNKTRHCTATAQLLVLFLVLLAYQNIDHCL